MRSSCIAMFGRLLAAWAMFLMPVAGARADLLTAPTITPTGAVIQATPTAANAFRVSFTPAPSETDSVQKVYYALLLNGRLFFETLDGQYHEWTGGEMPTMYDHAQSQCRTGNSFGLTISFPGIASLDEVGRFLPAGATFYAGFGADQEDLVAHLKFAPVFSVPAK